MRLGKLMTVMFSIQVAFLAGCGGGGSTSGSPADTVAPTVSLTEPVPNSTVAGLTTISAEATDNVKVTKVEFYLDPQNNPNPIGTVTSAPYTFTYDFTTTYRGTHTIVAKAYDAANNVGNSNAVTVTLPTITASMQTDINGTTAVGTVSLAGLITPDVFGVEVKVVPNGAVITSAEATGVAMGAYAPVFNADNGTVTLASASGFGAGDVLKIYFSNVPPGATSANFDISLDNVFSKDGIPIQ